MKERLMWPDDTCAQVLELDTLGWILDRVSVLSVTVPTRHRLLHLPIAVLTPYLDFVALGHARQ